MMYKCRSNRTPAEQEEARHIAFRLLERDDVPPLCRLRASIVAGDPQTPEGLQAAQWAARIAEQEFAALERAGRPPLETDRLILDSYNQSLATIERILQRWQEREEAEAAAEIGDAQWQDRCHSTLASVENGADTADMGDMQVQDLASAENGADAAEMGDSKVQDLVPRSPVISGQDQGAEDTEAREVEELDQSRLSLTLTPRERARRLPRWELREGRMRLVSPSRSLRMIRVHEHA